MPLGFGSKVWEVFRAHAFLSCSVPRAAGAPAGKVSSSHQHPLQDCLPPGVTQVTPKGAVRTGDTGSQGDRRWTLFSRPVDVEADCVRMWSLIGPGRGVGPGVVRLQQLDARCSKASLGEQGEGGGLESGKMMSTVLTMLDLQPLGACDGSGGWGLCVWFEAQRRDQGWSHWFKIHQHLDDGSGTRRAVGQ